MRLAVISDTHFGDDMCQLARWKDGSKREAVLGPKYEAFKEAAGAGNDYLILLGDIFDFSICSYEETYTVGKVFFEHVQRDHIANYMIYIPGNHDGDMWHFYEHEVNVIRRIAGGRPPRDFRFSVPAIIDGRKDPPASRFSLLGVSKNAALGDFGYGGLFLDKITTTTDSDGSTTGEPLRFAFAYPNAYLVTDDFTVMFTHGHYLEAYWSLLAEWAPKVFREDLWVGDALDISEWVALGFPLNQLACTGVGQAGPLTERIQKIQRQAKDKNLGRIKWYINNLDNEIDKLTSGGFLGLADVPTDLLSNFLKGKLEKALEDSSSTRYSEEFIHKPEVQDRFKRYFNSVVLEVDSINSESDAAVEIPRYVVFGHTHQPIPWGAAKPPRTLIGGNHLVRLYNTGGWLNRKNNETGEQDFCGADVLTFDSDRQPAFESVAIR